MESSIVAGWPDVLVAAAGAAAALAGFLFVTVSINLARIIELPGVSGRAAEAIILLSGTLAITLAALIPHLSALQLGWAISVIAVPTWFVPLWIQFESIRSRTYLRPSHAVSRALLHQVATLPGVFAGLSLWGLIPGGMAWVAAGAIASMLVAILGAWVLLVEILRQRRGSFETDGQNRWRRRLSVDDRPRARLWGLFHSTRRPLRVAACRGDKSTQARDIKKAKVLARKYTE